MTVGVDGSGLYFAARLNEQIFCSRCMITELVVVVPLGCVNFVGCLNQKVLGVGEIWMARRVDVRGGPLSENHASESKTENKQKHCEKVRAVVALHSQSPVRGENHV
jgi:hypothetical protein